MALLVAASAKAQEAYAVFTDDGTLTFYYDKQKSSRSGTKYGMNDVYSEPGWYSEQRQSIKKVIFDPSFVGARPKSTYRWFAIGNYPEKSILEEIVGIEYLNTSEVIYMREMFFGCSKLSELDVSHFSTNKVHGMSYMFAGCSGVTNLDVSHFDTSNVIDMGGMFSTCSSLSTLLVKNFDTSNVRTMDQMFSKCNGLIRLDITNFDTSNVTDMSAMFADCLSLAELDVTNFNTSNVTYMEQMFYNCIGLKNLDVTNFNTSNVTEMFGMFYGCSGFTNLNLSHFDTGKVKSMDSMFGGCSNLTSLDVSHFDTSSVKYMGDMFSGCSGLTNLNVDNFDTSKVTGMSSMFKGCNSLTSLDVSHFDTSSVKSMGDMFSGCSSLSDLDLSSFDTGNVESIWGMFRDCGSLKTIFVSDNWKMSKVLSSKASKDMFSGCTSLVGGSGTVYDSNYTDVSYAHIDGGLSNPGYLTDKNAASQEKEAYAVFTDDGTLTFYYDSHRSTRTGTSYDLNEGYNAPDWYTEHRTDITRAVFDSSFSGARPTSTYKWFGVESYAEKSVLTEIIGIEYLNTSEVTNMCSMFDGCSGLTTLDLTPLNTSKVTDMSYMFEGCSSLNSLDLTSLNTENVASMSDMFYGCYSLHEIDLSHFDTKNVTSLSGMFWNCGLHSINLSSFNTENVVFLDNLFTGCQGIKYLDISNFNTKNVKSMFGMFQQCTQLMTIIVGDNWSTESLTSSKYMFENCTKLVGGAGTIYDSNHVDVAYAHVDGGPSNPGYLTAKSVTPLVSNSDDLLEFILSLGENKGTEDAPAVVPVDENGLSIDKDVAIEDDLYLALYGKDESTPLPVYFVEGASLTPLIGSHFIFVNSSLNDSPAQTRRTNAETDYAGGINNKGCVTFANSTLNEGAYRVNNCTEGVLTLKANTTVGSDVLVNSGQIYTDGTVAVGSMTHRPGGKMYITGSLTRDINMSIDASDVELDVPIILGGEGYSLTEADLGYIHLTLPAGNEWKYDAVQGGIVVCQSTGLMDIDAAPTQIADSYDAAGRKVNGQLTKGITIQRMSDGTTKKIVITK